MNGLKYWSYFSAKLLIGTALLLALQFCALHFYPVPPEWAGSKDGLFLHDMTFTFLVLGVWFAGAGLLSLIVWDQRRRCRTCLRRLIMPVASGTWGRTVLGRPRTQWICSYGHGTLTIEELQITGRQLPDWQPHDGDIWKELESYGQARK